LYRLWFREYPSFWRPAVLEFLAVVFRRRRPVSDLLPSSASVVDDGGVWIEAQLLQ
jgi:hypothetical protein